MAIPTHDRAALFNYLVRLGRDLDEEQQDSLASTFGVVIGTDFETHLERLATSPDLQEGELQSLESAVRAAARPMFQLRDGRFDLSPFEANPWLASLVLHGATLENVARSVGRILLSGHPTLTWVGSGFHVGQGLLLTTRHVASIFAEPGEQLSIRSGVSATFECSTAPESKAFPITEVLLIHPEQDVALLRSDSLGSEIPLELDGSETVTHGSDVAVIGHGSGPVTAQAADPLLLAASAVKLVSLGKLVGYEHAAILDEKLWCLAHDCSTQTGFSGGPLVDIATGHILGVHFASQAAAPGILTGGGFAVPASELARDPVIRRFGIRFTASSPQPSVPVVGGGPVSVPSSQAPLTTDDLIVDRVTEALTARFSRRGKLDEQALVTFVEELGGEYAAAVAAQPGRGRVDSEIYARALVVSLHRRGLITSELEERLGLGSEKRAALGSDTAGLDESPASRELAQWIKSQFPLDDLSEEEQLSLLNGFPAPEMIARVAGQPPSLSEIVDRIGQDPSDKAVDALFWLLARLEERASAAARAADLPIAVSTTCEMVGLSFFRGGLAAARSIGRLMSRSGSGSTCWLIAPDLVVAPASIIGASALSTNASGGSAEPPHDSIVIEFEDEAGRPRRSHVRQVAFIDRQLDFALLRLKRSKRHRPPLQIRTDLVDTGPVVSIHHAFLHRKAVSLQGHLLSNDGQQATYVLATAPGSAGAPIFDSNWQVLALHSGRASTSSQMLQASEAKTGASMAGMVQSIRNSQAHLSLFREIVASQRALKSIDPSLPTKGEGAPQRIVIELIDEDTKLPRIAGLRQLSRLGRVVTALATPQAVDRLAEQHGVVSIEGSRSGATPECVRSIPHIRADQVRRQWQETGDKALIAVIDSGIDIHHETFLDDSGRTRILAFWDQQDERSSPAQPSATISAQAQDFVKRYGLHGGAVYLASDIEDIRSGGVPAPASFPGISEVTHGTVVCSIAAGRPTGPGADHFGGGVAPGAGLIVIRYDLADSTVGYSPGHVSALTFIDKLADDLGLPVVVNISNGMNGGAHDGRAAVEIACGEFCRQGTKGGRVIVKSAGNERLRNRHSELTVPAGAMKKLRFFYDAQQQARPGRSALEQIQLWMDQMNVYEFVLHPPSGAATSPLKRDAPRFDEVLTNGNRLTARYSGMEGENARSLLQLDLAPGRAPDVEPGTWRLDITAVAVRKPDPIHAWIELNSSRSIRFVDSIAETNTITVPGTAEFVITVGAAEVNDVLVSYDYSSMGPTLSKQIKPDIVAPGVAIVGAGAGRQRLSDLRGRDGTSLAAPHVAGTIALVLSAWAKAGQRPAPNMIQIRQWLLGSAGDFNPMGDSQLGYGRLDAEAFFRAASPSAN